MNSFTDISKMLLRLKEEISNSPVDIKAESLLLMAMEKGIPIEALMVNHDGTFKRAFSKDIANAELNEDKNKRKYLDIHLNRNGIFDKLPEGLFFKSARDKNQGNAASSMVAEHKENRRIENEARRFFLPYEHEFFLQRLSIEEQENLLLEGLQTGILNEYFIKFWNLPENVPSHLLTPIIILIPYAHRIAGDLSLMEQSLQEILRESVQLVTGTVVNSLAGEDLSARLGEAVAGLDFTLGEEFTDGDLYIDIIVGPLNKSMVTEFLPGGSKAILVETFNRFFMQAGIESKLTVIPNAIQDKFSMGSSQGAVLGVSTIL